MSDASNTQSGKSKAVRSSMPQRLHWRFEDLEILNRAAELAVKFHRIAERLDRRRLYRYAEQLRAAGLSISNNIAEGSGSAHKQEFIQFLNITRRSLFEDASMLLVFEKSACLSKTRQTTSVELRRGESQNHEFFSRTVALASAVCP